jgi:hypothetical protein
MDQIFTWEGRKARHRKNERGYARLKNKKIR